MRFCFASTQKQWGGGEFLLASFGREFQSLGHEVGWIVPANSAFEYYNAKSKSEVVYTMRSRRGSLADLIGVTRALRKWRPDALLLNDAHAVPLVGLSAKLLPGPKPLKIAFKHTIFPLRSKLKYDLLVDRVVCVSSAARQVLLDGGMQEDRIDVVYGGCTPPVVADSEITQLRESLGVRPSDFLLVAVGNLFDIKGHCEILKAVPLLLKSGRFTDPSQLRVVIAGEGGERSTLEKMIHDLAIGGNVQLLGFREDSAQLLASADLVVHPSHAEGLSLVLIQAQMLGKPVVSTAVGGMREVLSCANPERTARRTVPPKDPQLLANAILQARLEMETEGSLIQSELSQTAVRTKEMFNISANAENLAALVDRHRTRTAPKIQLHS